METWQTKQGHNTKEKIKNFQKVPTELKYSERVVILLTKAQLKIVLDYCEKNDTNKGELFRDAVVEYFQRRNVNLSLEPEPDPRQTKMF